MSKHFSVASRALRSVQRSSGSLYEKQAQRQFICQNSRLSKRTFHTRGSLAAQAASPASSQPSKSSTAGTEAALTSEPPASNFVLNEPDPNRVDWSKSFHGLAQQAFPKESADVLLAPIDVETVEIKPDGIIYLPEINYRRILNKAFGPGAWGLAPRGETIVTDKAVTREYALVAHGR